jgi:hypothetical protein
VVLWKIREPHTTGFWFGPAWWRYSHEWPNIRLTKMSGWNNKIVGHSSVHWIQFTSTSNLSWRDHRSWGNIRMTAGARYSVMITQFWSLETHELTKVQKDTLVNTPAARPFTT